MYMAVHLLERSCFPFNSAANASAGKSVAELQCMQRAVGTIVAIARTAVRNFSSNTASSIPRVDAADVEATSELLRAEQPFVLLGNAVVACIMALLDPPTSATRGM